MALALAAAPSALQSDQQLVEDYLTELLRSKRPDQPTPVLGAMRHAVLEGGQRVRPLLTLRVGRILHAPEPHTMRAAGAVELLHCASLIVDDLPCMDDAKFRRGKPAAHIAFGESTAVLAAFALVALAARTIIEDACNSPHAAEFVSFQHSLLKTLDCSSLIGGQAMDLGLGHSTNRSTIDELKTVPLFTLAVKGGYIFSNLAASNRLRLDSFAREFGYAFQAVDDYLDGDAATPAQAIQRIDSARTHITRFGRAARPLHELLDHLHARALHHRV